MPRSPDVRQLAESPGPFAAGRAPVPVALLRRFDVAVVCGPYKSGSSLLTDILEEGGYFDPSRATNPRERAYGTTGGRYLTRECALARTVNESLLGRGTTGRVALGPADYLALWPFPVVVKDPRFVFTLSHWLDAARWLRKSVCVCFTTRPAREIEGAWDDAPYTRGLLRRRVLAAMNEAQLSCFALCRNRGVPASWHTLASLRVLRTHSAVSGTPFPAFMSRPLVLPSGLQG
jgi:hypothetical protein